MDGDGQDLSGGDLAGGFLGAAAVDAAMPFVDQALRLATCLDEAQAGEERIEAERGVQRFKPFSASAKALPGRGALARRCFFAWGCGFLARRPLYS